MQTDSTLYVPYEARSTRAGQWVHKIASFPNAFEMKSLNHYPLNTDIDDGGPWTFHKYTDRPSLYFLQGKPNDIHHGMLTVNKPPLYSSLTDASEPTDSSMNAFGTKAIAATAPTNPAFDMSTLLGELVTGGLPTMAGSSFFKEQSKLARNAGSEYLNVEFGWKPLIRDVRDFAKVVKQSGKILEQYRKGSDTKIRVAFDGGTDDVTRTWSGNVPTYPSFISGPGTVSETRIGRQWFRGAFRYHIPVADSTYGKFQEWMSMADHLLGVRVTPETLWNIAPWSWALDWFANTGDIMANISNLGRDGLVLQYGYSMSSSTRETRITALYTHGSQRWYSSRTISRSYKRRRHATPYGFGVDLGSLSAKQVAIIAALGLSRT